MSRKYEKWPSIWAIYKYGKIKTNVLNVSLLIIIDLLITTIIMYIVSRHVLIPKGYIRLFANLSK